MAKKRIDEHTLKVLEFDQVLAILASFASSGLGKNAAMQVYPSIDPEWITLRMKQTTELKNLLQRNISIPLAGLKDITPLLTEFGRAKTVFEPEQLLQIAGTLTTCAAIRRFLTELPLEQSGHLSQMAQNLDDFEPIVDEINRCIEDEKKLRDDASPKLKELTQQVRQLTREITRRFKAIVSEPDMAKAIENDHLLTRHERVVVAVKTKYRQKLRGIVLDRSNTGATLYIEPEQLVEFSNELQDANFARRTEIGRILWQLTKAVIDRKNDILASLKTLALFDLTYAKARFSLKYQMAPPAICNQPCLNLRRARHPLLLHCVSLQKTCSISEAANHVVPIDVRLGEDFDLLLVTGPNTGGKTVMLKTIGLITLMAQSGMHIPAHPDSRLGIYRKIFADIGDEQSIQQSLSTFSAHISQIVHILKTANEKTLVLLDELGAGTDPTEGAVLATAILDKLRSRGGKIVATTHLGRLKSYAYSTPRTENASVQFDSETLQPTYVLRIGTPGSSNALAIAERLAMPKAVIKKARSLIRRDSDGTSDLINQVQTTRADAEQKRSDAQKILDHARELKTQADIRLKELKNQEKLLTEQANREIDKSMTIVHTTVEDFAAKMQNAPKPWSEHTDQLLSQIAEAAATTPLAVRQTQFIQTLRKGDSVYITSFRRNGIIDRINHKRRTITLLLEGKQLTVPFTEVWPSDNR